MYVKRSTYLKYESIIKLHLNPCFSTYMMNDINEQAICRFFTDEISVKNLSKSTLCTVRFVFKSICHYAEEKYHASHIHFEMIKMPIHNEKCSYLSNQEKQYLETYCLQNYNSLSIAIGLGLYAGLRIGEICSLQWQDIDLQKGIITISKTVQRLKNTEDSQTKTILQISSPKTLTSHRKVPIPHFFIQHLQQYATYPSIQSNDYVLSQNSKIMDPRTIQYQLKKYVFIIILILIFMH